MIIADKSYEVSDPTIDSQIVALHDSGADIFFSWAAPKGSAQAIRKVGELGWKPKFFLANTATSVAVGAEAGRSRKCQGHHLDGLSEGSDRSGLEGRSGRQDMAAPSWTSTIPTAIRPNANNVYGYVLSRRAWCRCSSSAATT